MTVVRGKCYGGVSCASVTLWPHGGPTPQSLSLQPPYHPPRHGLGVGAVMLLGIEGGGSSQSRGRRPCRILPPAKVPPKRSQGFDPKTIEWRDSVVSRCEGQ